MLNQTKEETLNSIDSSDEAEMESDDGNEPNTQNEAVAGPSGISSKPVKKKKRGIIYVSTIPKHMTVAILREMLGQYAKVGRIFLQPGKTTGTVIFIHLVSLTVAFCYHYNYSFFFLHS